MNNTSKETLDALARETIAKRRGATISQESIRKQLADYALIAIASYKDACAASEPEARRLLSAVIIPWWQDFESSQLFANIKRALAGSFSSHLRLQASDPIEYFWPKDAFSDRKTRPESDTRPHEILAHVILDNYQNGGISIAQNIADRGRQYQTESWRAIATIKNWGTGRTDFYFSRWPTVGAGFGFAIASHSYHVPITEGLDMLSPGGLNPAVLIEFAGQIQSGHVWDVLADSFTRSAKKK